MHCCKKLAVSDKVQQMCQTYSTNDRYLWVKEIEIQGHVARKTTATNGGNVGMMETGVCAHSGVVLSRHAPTLRRENRDVRISQRLSRPKKGRKEKTDVRTQSPLREPNVQTAAVSSFHSFTAEILMRSQSRVCPDHRFLPQPVTYLSTLIEFTGIQSASFSCSSSLSVLGLSERRAATHLPVCLQTFYITASALVKPEHASVVTGRRKKKKRDRERIES